MKKFDTRLISTITPSRFKNFSNLLETPSSPLRTFLPTPYIPPSQVHSGASGTRTISPQHSQPSNQHTTPTLHLRGDDTQNSGGGARRWSFTPLLASITHQIDTRPLPSPLSLSLFPLSLPSPPLATSKGSRFA